MSNEVEIGGLKFKLGKLNAYQQFHVVRRVGPLLSDLFPALSKVKDLKDLDKMSDEEKFKAFSDLLSPVAQGFSKLSDVDADYCLNTLLSSVEVNQAQFGTWARVATKDQIMIQDIELPVLLQVAGRALMFNLKGFFDTLHLK
jgi:hypothetical protein